MLRNKQVDNIKMGGLHSSGMLRDEDRQLVKDVSGKPLGPIFKG